MSRLLEGAPIGVSDCSPAALNSTGAPASVVAFGSADLSFDHVTLQFRSLPPSTILLALGSRDQGFTAGAGGGQGDLCLGGAIGRFLRPGELRTVTPAGTTSLAVTLTDLPSPTGSVAAMSGETWNFQGWYRDANPQPTHSFTDAIGVLLQ